MTSTPSTIGVYIDWDYVSGAPDFSQVGDNVTAYYQNFETVSGISDAVGLVASVGTCDLTLDNSDRRFSPLNSSSTYYGKMIPGRPVKITVTQDAVTYTLWTGKTKEWDPRPGIYGQRSVTIHCEDRMADLQEAMISIPIQDNIVSDVLLKHAINAALRAAVATNTVQATGNLSDGDTVNVNGTIYTAKAALGVTANQFLISTTRETTIANLAACINGAEGAGTTYTSASTRPAGVTGSAARELASRQTCWHDEATVLTGGALASTLDTSQRYFIYSKQTPGALGDSFSHSVWLQAGTYTFTVLSKSSANGGTLEWRLDDVVFMSGDPYGPFAVSNAINSGSVTVTQDGYHTLKAIVTGKPVISTGYDIQITKYWFTQVSD